MTARNTRRRYAVGKRAVAECQRSGQKMPYRELVEDGHIPGLLVHPDWFEPRHPQELPVDATDAIALYRPAPEVSIPPGEFDTLDRFYADLRAGCPSNPLNLRFFETTTVAVPPVEGARQITVERAVRYEIYECLFVELDGGGWFVSPITTGTPCTPQFFIPSVIPWEAGLSASVGNQVFVGTGENNPTIMNGAWVIESSGGE